MSNNQIIQNQICTIDPYKFLNLKLNSNGSITRLQIAPSTPPCSNPNSSFHVLSKDVPLNLNKKTSLRLFLPKMVINSSSSSKIPIIVYFHGGGFIFHQSSSTMFHNFCMKLSSVTNTLVVSVDYRLAPEHRLPAAFDDGVESLLWISSAHGNKRCNDKEWLNKYGDFSNCFLMGSSAGGTLAYKLGLRVSNMVNEINPLVIKGWILHHPSFGGSYRTRSELNFANDPYVPLSVIDLFSEYCLPVGMNAGHDYINIKGGDLDLVRKLGWRVLLTGGSCDPFVDRQVDLVKLMGEKKVMVMSHFIVGDTHAVEIFDKVKCDRFLIVVKNFICVSVSSRRGIQPLMTLKANL